MMAIRTNDVLRPFLWVALLAFLIGFGGYVALTGVTAPAAHERAVSLQLPPVEAAGPVRRV